MPRGPPRLAPRPLAVKLLNPEWKTAETTVSSTPAALTPVLFNLCSSIAQGVAYNQRVGDGIVVKEIEISALVSGLSPQDYFAVLPCITVEASVPASDVLLSNNPQSGLDRHIAATLAPHWRTGLVQAAEGKETIANVPVMRTWQLRGNWPIRWDRTGDPAGPQLQVAYIAFDATTTFTFRASVTYTDA